MTDAAENRFEQWVERHIRRLESWIEGHFLIALLLLMVLAVNELWLYGTNLLDWDPMLISGAVAALVALRLALSLPERIEETLRRLVQRRALEADQAQLDSLREALGERAKVWQPRGGVLIAAAIVVAFVLAWGEQIFRSPVLVLVEAFAAYIAGRHIARVTLYGRLGDILSKRGLALHVQPGHLDGAAGLKPVGEMYFFQAMLLAIPAAHLAIWWVLIPAFERYHEWRDPYAGLLLLVLALKVLAFLLPIWSFHREMQRQKSIYLERADKLSFEVQVLQDQLARADTSEDRDRIKEDLAAKTQRYWDIEHMPTWPVDATVRKRFTISNGVLFLPILGQSLQLSGLWQATLEGISNILSG